MRLHYALALFAVMAASCATAKTVIYTSQSWPVINPDPDVIVQLLDDVSRLEQNLFPDLPINPELAQQQIAQIMQQPDWPEQEARLTRAYQALTEAWSLGIKKVPAIVFDNREVVYGTTDVQLVRQLRQRINHKEQK